MTTRPTIRPDRFLARLYRDRTAATAIEYGLIVAMIFLAIAGAIRIYANSAGNMYNSIVEALPF